jgi:hypothetical protein
LKKEKIAKKDRPVVSTLNLRVSLKSNPQALRSLSD